MRRMMMKKKVLIIAAHMDDEVLGCGGAIQKHKNAGSDITVVFIAHRVYNHSFDRAKNLIEQKHALKAKSFLKYDRGIFLDLKDERLDASVQDIIMPLEKIVKEIRPELVYVPFRGDNNQDHRAVFDAARVALRPAATPFVKEVNMYEVPSSTEQSPPLAENAFLPNLYIDLKPYFSRKLKALMCYETEKRRYPHPRSGKAVKILAQKRGTEIGYHYAEAFVTIRRRLD